jgi:phosphoglycolate phosphatase-like HAD superfamily hydrolase
MKPVVALDIDGTLLDYHSHFLRFAAGYLGTWDPDEPGYLDYDARVPLHTYLRVSKITYRKCKLAYRRGEMKRSLPLLPSPFPQADELTRQLRRWGCDVWLCTTRPYLSHDMVDDATRHNLRRNGVVYQGLIWGEHKYRELVRTVGKDRVIGVLDDLPAMCQQAHTLGLPTAFAVRPHNAAEWLDLGAVRMNWHPIRTHDDTLDWFKRQLNVWRSK